MISKTAARYQGAFTLTELLVVIGIIGVLIALIFAGVGKVRGRSDQATCANNLKQLGAAILTYAADNGGRLPPGNRQSTGNLGRILSTYTIPMKTPTMAADIFYCPANVRLNSPPAEGYPTSGGYKGWSGYFLNYLFNASIFPITNSDPTNPGFTPDEQGQVRLISIQIPAKTVALMDMRTRAPGVGGPPSSGLARNTYFDPGHANYSLGAVHNNQGNILFLDGHVEAFPDDMRLPVNSLPDRTTTWWP